MVQKPRDDRTEKREVDDYCDICEASPCRWDGLVPDDKHAPYPLDHDVFKCVQEGGTHDDRYLVLSRQDGAWVMRLDERQASGRSCYVCHRDVTNASDVVPTSLQVIGTERGLYRDFKYVGYLIRHRTCRWPTWQCGCPYGDEEHLESEHIGP